MAQLIGSSRVAFAGQPSAGKNLPADMLPADALVLSAALSTPAGDVAPGPTRLLTLPTGEPALDINRIRYQDYLERVMPYMQQPGHMNGLQRWGTWMIRNVYQKPLRATLYKWNGNPCRYKKEGNLSCSEYTLMQIQARGFWPGVAAGWRRISDEDPYLLKHPMLMLGTLPVVGKWFRQRAPQFDYSKLSNDDAPIPTKAIKDPQVLALISQLPQGNNAA
jgi:putative component of membrane protein insertase Oxa1/YidC/SpoIIIJ protein YidD